MYTRGYTTSKHLNDTKYHFPFVLEFTIKGKKRTKFRAFRTEYLRELWKKDFIGSDLHLFSEVNQYTL